MTPPPPPPPPPAPPGYDLNRMEANGRYQKEPETPSFLIFMNALNGLTHFLLGAIVFSAFSYAMIGRGENNGWWHEGPWINTWWLPSYSQHIYLCVTGYVILMSQALLVFNPYVGWATNLLYPQKRMVHIIMQISGSFLAITGCIIKMSDSDTSFNSTHGVLGFIAMLLTILSLIGGVLNFIFSRHSHKNALFQILHTCFGTLTVIVAFVALIVAFYEYHIVLRVDGIKNMSIVFTVFALFGLLILIFIKLLRRK